MNYQEALDRLGKRDSKKIGHRLTLFKSPADPLGRIDRPDWIGLEYYHTEIIRWQKDKLVWINDGGYLPSRFTVEKINEYLPKGWQLMTMPLKNSPGDMVAVVRMGNGYGWYDPECRYYPYSPKVWFGDRGRTDLDVLNSFDAYQLIKRTEKFVSDSVNQFMSGKLSLKEAEESMYAKQLVYGFGWKSNLNTALRETATIDMLEGRCPPSLFVASLLKEAEATMPEHSPYWAEWHRLTGNRSRASLRQKALELEFRLGHPEIGQRIPSTAMAFKTFKRRMKEDGVKILLVSLGFEVQYRKSWGHRYWAGSR